MEKDDLRNQFQSEIESVTDEKMLKDLEVRWLGKKGLLTAEMKTLGELSPEQRKEKGRVLNELKRFIEENINKKITELKEKKVLNELSGELFDITVPGIEAEIGHLHPLTIVQREVEEVFEAMGFYVMDYPEAESEYNNFEALNIPADHPARDMQDTFWLENGNLLRTHTSAGQVRAMREITPPFMAVFPGRIYRYEATDASHEHTFDQVEGLMIGHDISVANMLSTIMTVMEGIFRHKVKVRLRPGYFPFVEPGFEMDLLCMVCGGKGCSVCKHSGWVEMLGCGPVHPNVIRAGGLSPETWTGWAFGIGLSRLVMMKYKIDDIRWLLSGDLRFLEQF
jgi:phenylalanyl-tRNA synthetase alpha chain